MKAERQVLTHCYSQARKYYKQGELGKARDYLDYGIGFTATKKIEGMGGEDLIEGIKINLWLERFWMKLENWDLLL